MRQRPCTCPHPLASPSCRSTPATQHATLPPLRSRVVIEKRCDENTFQEDIIPERQEYAKHNTKRGVWPRARQHMVNTCTLSSYGSRKACVPGILPPIRTTSTPHGQNMLDDGVTMPLPPKINLMVVNFITLTDKSGDFDIHSRASSLVLPEIIISQH